MRKQLFPKKENSNGIRTQPNSRLDNLTDAVFGIAITLSIYNLTIATSFRDLYNFAFTLPAFLICIVFLYLFWKAHVEFSRFIGFEDSWLQFYNVLFITLIIFYTFPLRILTLMITQMVFSIDMGVQIESHQVPLLMIYYGFVFFSLYFLVFLMYSRAQGLKPDLPFNPKEKFMIKANRIQNLIMFSVPLLSIVLAFIFRKNPALASTIAGFIYFLYIPFNIWFSIWQSKILKSFG